MKNVVKRSFYIRRCSKRDENRGQGVTNLCGDCGRQLSPEAVVFGGWRLCVGCRDRRHRAREAIRAFNRQLNFRPRGLPSRYAKALDMRMEGRLYREIAAEFGVSVERARQMVRKAQRLRDG
jgi:hypothetical protein